MKTFARTFACLLLAAASAGAATKFNPFTGKPDYVGSSSAGGASTLAISTGSTTATVIRSSPTAIVNFDSNTFSATLTGGATAFVTLNPSSVTLQGNNLSATYLTNSSATATYANQSVFASATSTGVLTATDWNTFNGAGSTLQIPQTAVAVGTSSNTVTGDSTTFSWNNTSKTLMIGGSSPQTVNESQAMVQIGDDTHVGSLSIVNSDPFTSAEWRFGTENNQPTLIFYSSLAAGIKNIGQFDGTELRMLNNGTTMAQFVGHGLHVGPYDGIYNGSPTLKVDGSLGISGVATFSGNVNLSSGVLCGGSAGTLGQFMASGGSGGPCSWTTGSSGGASSLAVTTGTSAGFSSIASSPTAIVNFDSTTFSASLTGSATAYVTLNASSVTLQGNNLAATYLTNSSATATYLNQTNAASTYLTQSSATATYANKSVFATTTSTGVLSATDWNTFNGKQSAGSYLTAVAVQGPLQGNGTAGSPLFTSTATATSTGSLTSTDWNTFNNKQASGAYLTAVTAQSPISGNGTAASPLITSTATATSTGSLTAADWSTFNGKGVGTITGITTQNGLVGGGTSGALTISVSSVSLSTQVVGNLSVNNLNSGTGATSSTFWRGDGSWQSVTGSGDNLGNHIATTTLNMASFDISNIGTSSSTFDAKGALTTKSSATLAGSVFISSQVTTTGNYTATGGDSVLYSSVTTSTPTITLPPATNTGQVITIYKVDTSTVPVIIKAAGTDTIVGISTVTLWAYGYQQTLRADGTSTWWPVGRLASQPMTLGWNSDIASAAAGVANRMYFYSWRLDDPCDTKSIRYMNGAVSGNLFFAIYNETGNVMVSSGPFAMPAGATAAHTITITKKNLQPGLYYVGFGADNATATFQRYASDQVGGQYSKGSMNPIPVSIGYPPTFDSATSSRAPTLTVQCYGGPADL